MLLKPTVRIPHSGGKRFDTDSPEYRTLARWIGQGMPFAPDSEPTLIHLDAHPSARVARGNGQQLWVVAHYSDGSVVDVTRRALYQSNAADLADVDDVGHVSVKTGAGVGEAAVMVRFGGRIAVARVTVPLGAVVPPWDPPTPRNMIDGFVFDTLKILGIPPSPPCTDAEFARRSSLDICGELPDPVKVIALENNHDPDKRSRWVDRLTDRPEYADRFAMTWSAILRNKRSLSRLSQPGTFAFHAWIRQALAANMPYDRSVAAILTAMGEASMNPPVVWFRQVATVEE